MARIDDHRERRCGGRVVRHIRRRRVAAGERRRARNSQAAVRDVLEPIRQFAAGDPALLAAGHAAGIGVGAVREITRSSVTGIAINAGGDRIAQIERARKTWSQGFVAEAMRWLDQPAAARSLRNRSISSAWSVMSVYPTD